MKTTLTILGAVTLAAVSAAAQSTADATVRDIAPYTVRHTSAPAPLEYAADGTSCYSLSDDGLRIERRDIKTGRSLETVMDLTHTRETTLTHIDGFRFSPDASYILVWNDVRPIYRRSTTAAHYVYEVRTRQLKPLSQEFDQTSCPLFSDDSRMVAFVHDGDIYLKKFDYGNQVRVTDTGRAGHIINGATDWTYEEEFRTTSLMTFTADSELLCFVTSDESDVPTYTLPLYQGTCNPHDNYALYPGSFSYKYPVAGQPNSTVTLHCYEIDNRKTKTVTLPDTRIEYIPRIDHGPKADQLMVTTLNRDQNHMEIYSVNPRTGITKSVYSEDSQAWIDPATYEDLDFGTDGFTVRSMRSGYSHLYRYSYYGSLTRTITSGDHDVTAYYGSDAAGNHYFQTAQPTPMDRTVWRVDAKGVRTRLGRDKGTTSARFNKACTYAVMTWSDALTPPLYTVTDNRGNTLRTLLDNSANIAAAGLGRLPVKEFVTVPGDDGLQLNAYIIKPLDFDPSRQYPVVMYQYSGPGSQSVLNAWGLDWQQYFARKGYIVFCVDGRGTGGRGAAFMQAVYRNLGHYETADQLAGARYLASQPWVDASRMGMHGWSYGGYETLMCLQAQNSPFKAGVAVAPVTDWRFYDTVYAERYMLTPQQNFDGYRTSAPLNFADKMRSQLLLITGTADDNVHPANTYQYVSALQHAGLLCDMLLFPNMNHSINGCNSRALVYGAMYRYFTQNL